MRCPNCGAEVREGAAFCESCGAAVPSAAAAAMGPTEQPTSPMPTAPAYDQAAYDAAVYAQKMAEYERQKAAYDQQQYAQQQAAYQQQYAQQQAAYAASTGTAATPKKTGLIVAIAIIGVLLLVGCGVGGFFAFRALKDTADDTPGITTGNDDAGDAGISDTDNALDSYDTAEEAVQAQLDASGVGDWVYQLYEEGDGYATYWAGPPNSEYVDEIYLEQNLDGTWSVIEVSSLDYGGDVSDYTIDEGNNAMAVVDQHLTFVSNDQGLEAQSLTVDPFHSDSASAQVSAGGLDYFEVIGYTEQSDGSFWVQTTQSWYGSVEGWEYLVVPTEAGLRIADVRLM